MKKEYGIGYSPLTDKVYLGYQNKEKGIWVGDKKDITNDFLEVIFQYFEENSIRHISSTKGKSNLIINIKNDKESLEKLMKNIAKRIESFK